MLAFRHRLRAIVVGAAPERAAELRAVLGAEARLPALGWIPPRLADAFDGLYAGLRRPGDAAAALAACVEASSSLDADELTAAAARRGFVPSRARRLLTVDRAAAGRTVAVAAGSPLEPFALENTDLLQAAGLRIARFDLSRDEALPPDASGLFLCGGLDESGLAAFAANAPLKAALTRAVSSGLPTLAMGGGSLLLLDALADTRGAVHQLAGALAGEAELLDWYERPRYVPVRAAPGNPFDHGDSVVYDLFDEDYLLLEQGSVAYEVDGAGGRGETVGQALPGCVATTLVASLPGSPALAAGFVGAVAAREPQA